MKIAGATEIYKLGEVYGIGALVYGTETINKVEKIAGPGNAYVTAAKKVAYGDVARHDSRSIRSYDNSILLIPTLGRPLCAIDTISNAL